MLNWTASFENRAPSFVMFPPHSIVITTPASDEDDRL